MPPPGRWQRYWFADGGRIGAAIVRIGIACAVLGTLYRLATLSTVQIPGPATIYRPVGIWMLFGHWVPPDGLITALWVIAWASTGTMLLGFRTRTSTAVSFVSTLALVSGSFASTATWSHQYNVVMLAQCAFLGARGGDALSLDALIWKPAETPRGYQWSLRLVQLAVALMFAGAVFHKFLHGHGTLRWALSDNLRHHLLVRYDLTGLPRPPLVDWIIDDVWKFRIAALLNMASQLAPIAAVIFVRRPLVRAAAGMFFVIETLALGFVVSLWNLHWLPLVVVFVDWDRLIKRDPPPVPDDWKPPRAPKIFIIAFFAYELVTAFVPTLDQKLNTFPFSGFPMFATIRARAPYGEHLPYDLPGDHYEVTSAVPLTAAEQRWFDHGNRWLYDVRDPDKVKARLVELMDTAKARYPDKGIRSIKHWLAIYEAPAYPEPARLDMHPIAISGEIAADHTYKSYLSKDPKHATGALTYYRDNLLEPRPYTGVLEGDEPYYIVTAIDGEPWLVGVLGSIR